MLCHFVFVHIKVLKGTRCIFFWLAEDYAHLPWEILQAFYMQKCYIILAAIHLHIGEESERSVLEFFVFIIKQVLTCRISINCQYFT